MKNKTIWITGLSGSGKSTLAKKIVKELRIRKINVLWLDGDRLRNLLNFDDIKKNYTIKARFNMAKKYSLLCKEITDQGMNVVVSTISLFNYIHKWNKKNLKNYFEIYLKVPIKIINKRDPKKIYKNFNKGILKNVVGLDLNFEEPKKPNLLIENYNTQYPINTIIEKIINNK